MTEPHATAEQSSAHKSHHPQLPWAGAYLAATGAVIGATALRHILTPVLGDNSPLLLYSIAVLLSAWRGGLAAGLYATALSAAAGLFFFLDSPSGAVAVLSALVFSVLGVAITLLVNHMQRAAVALRTKERELSDANRRYAELLEVTSDSVFLLSRDWRFIYLNPRAIRQISGGRELLGQSIWEAFPEAEKSEFGEHYKRAMSEQIPVSFTARYAPLGAWFEVRAYPSESGLAVYFRDVTEQREAEEALHRSERRFRGTFENAAVGMAHVGLNGKLLLVNDRLCEITGYRREELLSRTFQDITHPDDLAADMAQLERMLRGEIDSYGMEKRYVDPAGRSRWVYLTVSLERDEQAQPQYFISIVQDIAERKRAEEALQHANDDLRQFAYAASHDLQEPLRMVISFTQLLLRRYGDKLDSEGQRYIEFAVSGAARMESLLRGLRAYWSASETDRAGPVSILLKDVVAEAVLNLESVISSAGAVVTCDEAPPLCSEPTPLTQVFQNLIANGVKYRHPARTPKIHVSAEPGTDGFWKFSVADNGVGIPPEYRNQVFGLFKRLHPYGESGSGIGLALCQKIVERRGGRIWVESSSAEGTTFRFTFPARLERAS